MAGRGTVVLTGSRALGAGALLAIGASKVQIIDPNIVFAERGGGGTSGTDSQSKIKINTGQQDKHIPGTNNYKQEIANGKPRSILNEDPQKLLNQYSGKGQKIGTNKERVNFKKIIGKYYDVETGTYTETTKGIIHYNSKGEAHIVPARP